MRSILVAILITAIFLIPPSTAHAARVVTCGNCTQAWQYESAGEMAHGPRSGWEVYLVVNPNTAQALYVTVNYVPPGEVPRRLERTQSPSELDRIDDVEVPAWRLPSQSAISRRGQGDFDSSSQGLAEGERLQLEAIVKMSKDWVFIKPHNGSGYFSSVYVANQFIPAVDDAIRNAHTTKNPAWLHNELNGNLVRSLFRSLDYFFGKGIGGCLLMDNGDTACWQINPMARGSARLIEGTAKNVSGDLLPASDTIKNGGDIDIDIDKGDWPREVRYIFGGGHFRCGSVNGRLDRCEWVLPR